MNKDSRFRIQDLRMRTRKNLYWIVLVAIIVFGGFLRIYGLDISPPSLNWDEAAYGYNAYSIAQTGRDEYGNFLPVFLRSFNDYKAAIPAYLMIPSLKFFGLSETGVRFPTAFLGTLSILLIYLISERTFKNKKIALFASFVFAIEPWSVHFSRIFPDVMTALFFFLLGYYLFLLAKAKPVLYPISLLVFILSAFSYNTNKLLVPLFIIVLLFINRGGIKKLSRPILGTCLFLTGLAGVIFGYFQIQGQLLARASNTTIFSLWNGVTQTQNMEHSLNTISEFFIHNQLFYFLWEILARYTGYFSPHNLFLREPQEPSTIIASQSILHPFEFIFLFVGLGFVIKNYKKFPEFLMLLLISPIPAVLTWNYFIPYRAVTLFAIYSVLIGVGIFEIGNLINSKLKWPYLRKFSSLVFATSVGVVGICCAIYLFDSIQILLPYRDAGNYQAGLRETVWALPDNLQDYDEVIVDTSQAQPHIFYAFYSKYPPAKFQEEKKLGKNDFGNFKFRSIYWPKDRYLPRTLFIGNEFSLPESDIKTQPGAQVINIVKNKQGDIIAKIVTTN